MASEDLVASMKALNLSTSQDIENLKVGRAKTGQTRAPKWNSKNRGNRPAVSYPDKFTANVPKTQGKLTMGENIPSVAQKVELGSSPNWQASKKNRQRSRHYRKGSGETNIQNLSNETSSKQQELTIAHRASKESNRSTSIYVVEVAIYVPGKAGEFEDIIGVYTLLSEANKAVIKCAEQFGISETEIKDIVSSFAGPKPSAQSKATRRVWPNGTSEVRNLYSSCSRLTWIKILPKDFADSAATTDSGTSTVYLALDRSIGLFVVGVYASKEEAWKGCQKYWTQLSYCTPIEDKEQWYDRLGMYHAKGAIGGRRHHWFIKSFNIDAAVDGLAGS